MLYKKCKVLLKDAEIRQDIPIPIPIPIVLLIRYR